MAMVITYGGLGVITDRLKGAGGAEPKYIGWGTGAGTATRSRTTLYTEASESRVAGTSSRLTIAQTNDTYQVSGTMTAGGTKTITNAGLFDASSGGNLFEMFDFTGIALSVGNTIGFVFKCQFL